MTTLQRQNSGSGGDVLGSGGGKLVSYGWSTAERPIVAAIKIVYAFQDGRWVFSDVIADGKSWPLFLSILGKANTPGVTTRFSESAAQR